MVDGIVSTKRHRVKVFAKCFHEKFVCPVIIIFLSLLLCIYYIINNIFTSVKKLPVTKVERFLKSNFDLNEMC